MTPKEMLQAVRELTPEQLRDARPTLHEIRKTIDRQLERVERFRVTQQEEHER